ncbi:MAG: 3-dehydroquinate synthase family protein [Planctomycetota bacterium]
MNATGTQIVLSRGSRAELTERLTWSRGGYVLVMDAEVERLWGAEVLDLVPEAAGTIRVPAGESAKSPETLVRVCRELVRIGLPRSGCVVAIGGGATGDLSGLAAALHLRGVSIVQVPTTLLAMVDASLGGKCAVNIPEGKNLIGCFHLPELVLVDPDFLGTLPEIDFLSGVGEVAKYAIGFSRELFGTLERDGMPAPGSSDLVDLIQSCLCIKSEIVSEDPTEREGRRRVLLNLGHTTAHALETHAASAGTRLPHGLAVALGLRVALELAAGRGLLAEEDRARSQALLDRLGLPARLVELLPDAPPPTARQLGDYLRRDKKRRRAELRVVLPLGLGHSGVEEIAEPSLTEAILAVC